MAHCDYSDLPAEMCSHCRGLDEPPAKEQAEYWTTAGFPSRCPSCDGGHSLKRQQSTRDLRAELQR